MHIWQFWEDAQEFWDQSVASPHLPQPNGSSEKAADIKKQILPCGENLNYVFNMLAYRNASLESGLFPAVVLYRIELRTTIPTLSN